MNNLSVENLSRVVQTGDIESLYGSSASTELRQRRDSMTGVGASSEGGGGSKTFTEILKNSMDQVNHQQSQADTAIKELVAGRSKNIHETMLTIERADTSMKLMMQVRNKILEAYKEIMRMQV